MYFIIFLYIIFWFLLCGLKIKQSLHIIQLEGYSSDKYMNWVENNKNKIHTKDDKIYLSSLIIFSVILILTTLGKKVPVYALAAYAVVTLIFLVLNFMSNEDSKKPLVFTNRAKRLYGISLALVLFDLLITIWVIHAVSKDLIAYIPVLAGILTIIYYFSSYYMYGANYISMPIENNINNKFYIAAQNKIKNMEGGLISVGITGSYGKTSTKFIATTIIKEKYNVLNLSLIHI